MVKSLENAGGPPPARTWLAGALEILLSAKPYESIRVKDLTEKVGVNRSTFYLHFRNLDAMVLELFEGRLNELLLRHAASSNDAATVIETMIYSARIEKVVSK